MLVMVVGSVICDPVLVIISHQNYLETYQTVTEVVQDGELVDGRGHPGHAGGVDQVEETVQHLRHGGELVDLLLDLGANPRTLGFRTDAALART